jgi:hypothetical protein
MSLLVLIGCVAKQEPVQRQRGTGDDSSRKTALPESKGAVGGGLQNSGTNFNSQLAMDQLISKLDGVTLEQLQRWAVETLNKSQVGFGVFEPELPLVRRLMPEQGIPAAVVWEENSGIGPSVMLTWRHEPIYSWGLILRGDDQSPTAPWLEIRKLKPGVFAYHDAGPRRLPEPVPGANK